MYSNGLETMTSSPSITIQILNPIPFYHPLINKYPLNIVGALLSAGLMLLLPVDLLERCVLYIQMYIYVCIHKVYIQHTCGRLAGWRISDSGVKTSFVLKLRTLFVLLDI